MYRKLPILALALLILTSFGVMAFEESPDGTYQYYKYETGRGGLSGVQDSSVTAFTLKCSVANGQDVQPYVADMDNDGKNEFIIYSGTTIRVYNGSCSIKAQLNTGINMGTDVVPTFIDLFRIGHKQYVVPDTNGNITIYDYDSASASINKFISFSGDTNFANNSAYQSIGVGVMCVDDGNQGVVKSPRCLWVSNRNSVCESYSTNDSNLSQTSFWTQNCVNINSTFDNRFRRVPSLVEDSNGGGYRTMLIGYDFDYDRGIGLMMWDYLAGSIYSSWANAGFYDDIGRCSLFFNASSQGLACCSAGKGVNTINTPIMYDFNNDGFDDIVVLGYKIRPVLSTCSGGDVAYNGSIEVIDGFSGDTLDIFQTISYTQAGGLNNFINSELVRAKDRSGRALICFEHGVSGLDRRECYYWNDTTNTMTRKYSVVFSGIEDISSDYEAPLVAVNLNDTGSDEGSEILSDGRIWDASNGGVNHLFNLTTLGVQQYKVIADLNNDDIPDIVSSVSGSTSIFWSAGFNGTFNNAPTISSVSPSSASPINKGSSIYYTYSASDVESNPIFSAVSCQSGDSTDGFSNANAGNTAHDICSYTSIGCKTAIVYVTDNQSSRVIGVDTTTGFPSRSINISVKNYCNDGTCDVHENYATCPADCSITTCGDLTCQVTEASSTCPIDCFPHTCSNAVCELNENFVSCPADCTIATCGNGYCNQGENTSSCPYDTFQIGVCGDSICSASETNTNCPADCTQITCGNSICDTGENTTSCPADCTICGNGVCEGLESSFNCPNDCPSPNLNIQTLLVDIDSDNVLNPEETGGLLPELYLGIQNFFSPFLIPLIAILFVVGFAMVFVAIIKKVS